MSSVKSVLITGIGGKVGKALLSEFKDYDVYLVGKSKEKLVELGGTNVKEVHVNSLSTEKEIIELFSKLPKINLIVNNTGIFESINFNQINEQAFSNVVIPTMQKQLLIFKHAIPYFKEQENGTIINLISKLPSQGFSGLYETGKRSLEQLSKFHIEDIKRNLIKVHTLEINDVGTGEGNVNPEDIAKMVGYLANLPQRVHIDVLEIEP